AQTWLFGILARNHNRERFLIDLRRSDDGISPGLGRSPGAVRHHTRSELFRKDHRRRIAGGRIRRASGYHGYPRPPRTGLSSGHPQRKSLGHGSRARRFGGTEPRRNLRAPRTIGAAFA